MRRSALKRAPRSRALAVGMFYLNSYNATDASSAAFCSGPAMLASTPPGCGNVVSAPIVFENGVTYTVKVVGTVSAWGQWPYRKCGKPEPAPEFSSPSRPITPTGDDAQFRFAETFSTSKCKLLAKKSAFFQVNLGGGWYHPIAVNNPIIPSGDFTGDQHPYTFSFAGLGLAPQFRFVDWHPSDNDGQFQITVNP